MRRHDKIENELYDLKNIMMVVAALQVLLIYLFSCCRGPV